MTTAEQKPIVDIQKRNRKESKRITTKKSCNHKRRAGKKGIGNYKTTRKQSNANKYIPINTFNIIQIIFYSKYTDWLSGDKIRPL